MVNIFINDDRAQFVGGVVLQPGKNSIEDTVWDIVKASAWAQYLADSGILSLNKPTAVLNEQAQEETPEAPTTTVTIKRKRA